MTRDLRKMVAINKEILAREWCSASVRPVVQEAITLLEEMIAERERQRI